MRSTVKHINADTEATLGSACIIEVSAFSGLCELSQMYCSVHI